MEFDLRKLTQNDIQEVSKIYVAAYETGIWNESWTYDMAQQRIFEMLSSPQYIGYVAITNGDIIGCIICEILTWHIGKQMEVKEIFVLPRYQKMGVGEKLINGVKIAAQEMGVTEVFLWTKSGQSLMKFYSDMGFQVNHEVVQFINKEMEELR
ncbi:GNAT family N-acetyltransferase [Pseudoflavonifractor sp. SW1122]|uniref:GNAT family N-acetyltransferase n=1 Tax=Pseudoflavonifractor sp. SW1122 TaxID=2530044 RepID=UPI00143A4F5A|nr:GNAT family N-acetyltransferase [Pseudoflavonifractor sp. SW1122]NJE75132.1 GNAT family N-acetyltransferase [Pseudoflavonifractor sp. SW1122]